MPRLTPPSPHQRAIAIVLILFGLVVSAVGLASAAGSALHGSGPAQSYGFLIGLLCFGAMVAVAMSFRRWQVDSRNVAPHSKTARLSTAAGAILLAGAILVPLIVIMISRSSASGSPHPFATPTSAAAAPATPPDMPQQNQSGTRNPRTFDIHLTLILIVIGVLLAIGVGMLVRRWLKLIELRPGTGAIVAGETPPELEEEQILADAMSAGRRALDGDDARAAIIACYAAMEESLAAVGLARGHADSPAELLDRAQSRGLLRGPGPGALAALFREARFSTHPMGAEQMTAARDALEQCTDQLRAVAEAS